MSVMIMFQRELRPFKNVDESVFWDVDVSNAPHFLLSFGLLLQQFHFSCNVTAVLEKTDVTENQQLIKQKILNIRRGTYTFCKNILPVCFDPKRGDRG